MRITQVRSEGLAHLSYFISSEGEAMVVDPRRDVDIYLELANQSRSRITHVFETHRNEDYVIGSLELQYHVPQVQICHSKETGFKYGDHSLAHQDTFKVGAMKVTCLHTPGHTDDSMCYLLSDMSVSPTPIVIFAGDTLFVGEVGRTDLVDKKKHEEMSRKLFTSLHETILPLGDGVLVYPGHGAGSVCGGNIGKREFSSIGYERLNNKWLSLDEAEFVHGKISQSLTYSEYFKHCERLNTIGPPLVAELRVPQSLDTETLDKLLDEPDHVVVDTRSPDFFVCGHIPGAISAPLNDMGQFAGWILEPDWKFLLVLERSDDLELARSFLLRIGFDNIIGYLGSGMEGWYEKGKPRSTIRTIDLEVLKDVFETGTLDMIDVRQPHEQEKEYIGGSKFIPLTDVGKQSRDIDSEQAIVTMCPGGVRATSAASLLKRAGHENISVALDGIRGWKKRGYPIKTRV
ncbi:MAG: MBL fold metallo-hydrolase [Candidatus Thorarchaeota archaeon]|jgi:hydroxyacylglutathione hydrolase